MVTSGKQGGPGLTPLERQRLLLRSSLKLPVMCDNPRPCRYGDRCMFAHSVEEIRVLRACKEADMAKEAARSHAADRFQDRSPSSVVRPGGSTSNGSGPFASRAPFSRDQPEGGQRYCHPDKFKTALCYNWQRYGACRHGATCTFAHGESELKSQGSGNYAHYRNGSMGAHSGGSAVLSGYTTEMEAEGWEEASPPAMAAAYPEEYALQVQHDKERELMAANAPPPPPLQVSEHFPSLEAAVTTAAAAVPHAPPAAAAPYSHTRGHAGGKTVDRAAVPPPKRADCEWERSSTASSGPTTVCLSESPLKRLPSSSGASQAGSVRSVGGEQEERQGSVNAAPDASAAAPADPSGAGGPPTEAVAAEVPQKQQEEAISAQPKEEEEQRSTDLIVVFDEDEAASAAAGELEAACPREEQGVQCQQGVPAAELLTAGSWADMVDAEEAEEGEEEEQEAGDEGEEEQQYQEEEGEEQQYQEEGEEWAGQHEEQWHDARQQWAEQQLLQQQHHHQDHQLDAVEEEAQPGEEAKEEHQQEAAPAVKPHLLERKPLVPTVVFVDAVASPSSRNALMPAAVVRAATAQAAGGALSYSRLHPTSAPVAAAKPVAVVAPPKPMPAKAAPPATPRVPPGFAPQAPHTHALPQNRIYHPPMGPSAAAAPPATWGVPIRALTVVQGVPVAPPPAQEVPAPAQVRPAAQSALMQRVSAAAPGVDLSLVPAFLCPLTGRPFINPVLAADGVTYEKEVITDWLYRQNKEVSPVTGKQLPHRLLLPNDSLRLAMGQVAELIRALAT